MKLKVRKTVTFVISFLMVFATAANPAYARWEDNSVYLSYSEDAMQTENLNAGDGKLETFNIAEQISLLHNRINNAYELLADTLVDVPPEKDRLKGGIPKIVCRPFIFSDNKVKNHSIFRCLVISNNSLRHQMGFLDVI